MSPPGSMMLHARRGWGRIRKDFAAHAHNPSLAGRAGTGKDRNNPRQARQEAKERDWTSTKEKA